jgi:hypothetical protein
MDNEAEVDLWGWCPALGEWVPIQVDANGKLVVTL